MSNLKSEFKNPFRRPNETLMQFRNRCDKSMDPIKKDAMKLFGNNNVQSRGAYEAIKNVKKSTKGRYND